MEDPFSDRQILVRPETISEAYKAYALKQEEMVKSAFLDSGADFIGLTTNESFVKPITNLFIKRERKIKG